MLSIYTIIPTTDGYKQLSDIKVGDKVFGLDRQPIEVVEVGKVLETFESRELFASNGFYGITVVSDNVQQYPIEKHVRTDIRDKDFYDIVNYEGLIKNKNVIIGNTSNLILLSHKDLNYNIFVRSIKVDSDNHIFLVVDEKNKRNDWDDKTTYKGQALYVKDN